MRRTVTAIGLLGLALILVMVPEAFSLPAGRHYEMVSQPFKAGYGVGVVEAAAPTGSSVAYTSVGSFDGAPSSNVGVGTGAPYIARREPEGWVTSPLMLPATLTAYIAPPVADYSSTFEQALFYGQPGANAGSGQSESSEAEFLTHPVASADLPSNFSVIGKVIKVIPGDHLNYESASADLSHVVFEVPTEGMPLTPEATGTTMKKSQYALVADGFGERTLKLIGVDNNGEPKSIAPGCNVELGSHGLGAGTTRVAFNAVSATGNEIFFTTCAGPSSESRQLFVRLNGERTLEVSRPLEAKEPFGGCVGEGNHIAGEVPCEGAATRPWGDFAGASEDGSKVFFTTEAHLTGAYSGSTNDLYVATIGCPVAEPECVMAKREVTGLKRVGSAAVPSESANVQGVIAVSPDGARVYFVAKGVLSGSGADGAPVHGADNLYEYDTATQSVAFVGDLCSANEQSGAVSDAQCPAASDEKLWADTPAAQVTRDGSFMVFASYARLTGDDVDNARDVFRYDAVTGGLVRVSVSEAGSGSNGNENDQVGKGNADAGISSFPSVLEGRVVAEAMLGARAITEDGSRIVFSTAESLSDAASNGVSNPYEWHEGVVSIVSSGADTQSIVHGLTITPSGNDIFFVTGVKLLGQDKDEVLDVYDARTGPDVPPFVERVEQYCDEERKGEEGCRPLSMLAPALVPTATQIAGENRPIGHPKGKATGKKKKKRKHKHKHKTRGRGKYRGRAVKSTRRRGQ